MRAVGVVAVATRASVRAVGVVAVATRASVRAIRLVAPASRSFTRAQAVFAYTIALISSRNRLFARFTRAERNAAVTLKTIPSATQAAYLASPEVRAAIQAVLKRRTVPDDDLEDLTHDVIERALVAPSPPASLEECKAIVTKMANDLAIDSWRRTRRRSKVNAGLYENPDDRPGPALGPGDAVYAREQIAFFRGQVDKGAITGRQAAILARHAENVPGAEIADELRVAHQTVHNELSAGRRALRASWAAYAAVGVLASVSLILWLLHDRDRTAKKTPREEIRPDPSAGPQTPTPLQIARDLRRDALHDCDVGKYDECLDGLDQAARVDPAGDASPVVKKARENAVQWIIDHPAPIPDDGKF